MLALLGWFRLSGNDEPCEECVLKHLGRARELFLESENGYPVHAWYALANMSLAEDELGSSWPELKNSLRIVRKSATADVLAGVLNVMMVNKIIEHHMKDLLGLDVLPPSLESTNKDTGTPAEGENS